MSEQNQQTVRDNNYGIKLRYRGRIPQVGIYLGKLLRMFIYQSDWKVLPMSALIALLVSMVVRPGFFLSMEGTLKGAFSLVCVGIWNGCFNSIQVICRERGIIKREHRAGMHVTSYIGAHMIYQALLCLAQTGLTLYIFKLMNVQFPDKGMFTRWMIADIGITLFLISYASDMLSLFVSAVVHNTTTAMTVMPFVLIFQLVFSGGIFDLPAWSESLSQFTISNYGLKCVCAQADYNSSPSTLAWKALSRLKNQEINANITLGQALDLLTDTNNQFVSEIRSREINAQYSLGEIWSFVKSSGSYAELRERQIDTQTDVRSLITTLQTNEGLAELRQKDILGVCTVGEVFDLLGQVCEEAGLMDKQLGSVFTVGQLLDALQTDTVMAVLKDVQVGGRTTVGELVDRIAANPDVQKSRDEGIQIHLTVGKIFEMIGEQELSDLVQKKVAEVSRVPAYDKTEENILFYWGRFGMFIVVFALMAVIALEFIDRDKR